jgi:hypothetical protein
LRMEPGVGTGVVVAAVDRRRRTMWRTAAAMAASGLGFRTWGEWSTRPVWMGMGTGIAVQG